MCSVLLPEQTLALHDAHPDFPDLLLHFGFAFAINSKKAKQQILSFETASTIEIMKHLFKKRAHSADQFQTLKPMMHWIIMFFAGDASVNNLKAESI